MNKDYKEQDLFVEDGFGNLKPNPEITEGEKKPVQLEMEF